MMTGQSDVRWRRTVFHAHRHKRPGLKSNGIRGRQAPTRPAASGPRPPTASPLSTPSTLRARALGRADGLVFRAVFIGAGRHHRQSRHRVRHLRRLWPWCTRSRHSAGATSRRWSVSAVRLDRRALLAAPLLAMPTAPPDAAYPGRHARVEVEVAALDFSASAAQPLRLPAGRITTRLGRRPTPAIAPPPTANVPPGSYRLRMRGSNRDGLWTAAGTVACTLVIPAGLVPDLVGAARATGWRLALGWACTAGACGSCTARARHCRHWSTSRTQHLERVHAIVKSINDSWTSTRCCTPSCASRASSRVCDSALCAGAASRRRRPRSACAPRGAASMPCRRRLSYRSAPGRIALRAGDCMIAPDIFEVHHHNSTARRRLCAAVGAHGDRAARSRVI
jgi:hypothetical protein